MYSISENIDNRISFDGWINEDILIKDSRGSSSNRKRGYQLAHGALGPGSCEEVVLHTRVLRPRPPPADPLSSSPPSSPSSYGASRTRPMRSNRARRRVTLTSRTRPEDRESLDTDSVLQAPCLPSHESWSSSRDSGQFQTSWPQNYLLAHSDSSDLGTHGLTNHLQAPSSSYSSRMVPPFDPWVLHNYLLASSSLAGVHLSQDPSLSRVHLSQDQSSSSSSSVPMLLAPTPHLPPPPEDPSRMLIHHHLGTTSSSSSSSGSYPASLGPSDSSHGSLVWQYPFLLNPHLMLHSPRSTLEATMTSSSSSSSSLDLSYLFRPPLSVQRDLNPNLPQSVPGAMYLHHTTDLPGFGGGHLLQGAPPSFTYGSLCPYHNTSHHHMLHHQSLNQAPATSSSRVDPSGPQYSSHHPATFHMTSSTTSSSSSPDLTLGGLYWPHHMTSSSGRGPQTQYPPASIINSSNIDTLLHLAAHFEQRKRGISRDELDKLPTHRYKHNHHQRDKTKPSRGQGKHGHDDDNKSSGGLHKCLVCLDDFESKQSIRTLRCNHEFHSKCIDKWLKMNRSCPLCRADAFDGTAQKDTP